MDFGKQYLEVVKNWVDLQTKVGQEWFAAVQGADKFDPSLVWDKTVDAYQSSIQGTLDAEAAGANLWFEGVAAVNGLPKEAAEFAQYTQGLTEQFIGTQKEFVKTWFELLRETDFSKLALEAPKEKPAKKIAAKA